MPHYLQARRKVSLHIIGLAGEYAERGEVVACEPQHKPIALKTGHFWDRGEHPRTPEPIENIHTLKDTTVYSATQAEFKDAPKEAVRDKLDDGEDRPEESYEIEMATDNIPDDDSYMDPEPHDYGAEPVTSVKGIGPSTAERYSDYGIHTVRDLAEADSSDDVAVAHIERAKNMLEDA